MSSNKEYLHSHLRQVDSVKKIRGEASNRSFYRIKFPSYSLIAMVYPQKNSEEITKISRLTEVYRKNNISVPEIKEIIDNRIILQEDLGDLLVQKAFTLIKNERYEKIVEPIADILLRLKDISTSHTENKLDINRLKWEMDFFLNHFAKHFLPIVKNSNGIDEFQKRLYSLAENIRPIQTFAHRDFHSRNMLVHKDRIYLIDFQDSLVASPYYDLVSFAFDCYLDLKTQRRKLLLALKERGMVIEDDQLYFVALQRNIKALGTFGYQLKVKKNFSYKKYIPRTLRHIIDNPQFSLFFRKEHFDVYLEKS